MNIVNKLEKMGQTGMFASDKTGTDQIVIESSKEMVGLVIAPKDMKGVLVTPKDMKGVLVTPKDMKGILVTPGK